VSTLDLLRQCEAVLAAHDALHRCTAIEPRRKEDQDADLRLLFTDRAWLRSPAGDRMREAFERHPAIASASRHRSALLLRFDDRALADLERGLAAAGDTACSDATDLLAGHACVVSFLGPNTNKALHVGHLRNVLLGHALASALTSAGASVRRHTLIGDIGRRVCEAMGGYRVHHDRQTPAEIGMPGDRFVELCSRDYVSDGDGRAPSAAQPDDPNAEEREPCGDLADTMMLAWLRGEACERRLWHRLREWALTGHEGTLARLGVVMDRRDFESEEIEHALGLVAAGLEEGTLIREETGAVVYRTGRSEYTTMVLLRRDGVPTEYARLLGAYHRIFGDLDPGVAYVELVGSEWQPVTAVLRELLRRLPHAPRDDAYSWIFHGSVTDGGRKMGSSTGEVVWIDDLLDRVAAGPGVASLAELAGGALSVEELADLVVRGTFLCAPAAQPLELALERLLERGPGPGWTIAEAWCRAQHPATPRETSPLARTAVVQSQLYRRALTRSIEQFDVAALAAYLLGLAEACLASPAPGPAAATVLRRALSSLGFPAARPRLRGDLTPARESSLAARPSGSMSTPPARGSTGGIVDGAPSYSKGDRYSVT
jgi:arginyl-tRNA synthetase